MDKKATTNCKPSEQALHLQYFGKDARERSQDIQIKNLYNYIFRFFTNLTISSGSEERRFFSKNRRGYYVSDMVLNECCGAVT